MQKYNISVLVHGINILEDNAKTCWFVFINFFYVRRKYILVQHDFVPGMYWYGMFCNILNEKVIK